jgi:hypothetical protein
LRYPETLYFVNTVYMWPANDLFLLGVMNSPLMWSYMWRNAQHGKDEALRLFTAFLETAPVPRASDDQRALITGRVERLMMITAERHRRVRQLLDWRRVEFGVEKPGQKLSEPHELDSDTFVAEVKKRRAGKSTVTASELRRLREEFYRVATPLREGARESLRLESEVSDLVNEAYGLTPEEVDLLWQTAPPRMPNVARREVEATVDLA